MGKVTYSPGIEYVNGALAKAKKKDGHRCGDYLIGTHRTAATQNPEGHFVRAYVPADVQRVGCSRTLRRCGSCCEGS